MVLNGLDLRKHAIGVLLIFGCLIWLANTPRYNVKEVDAPGARELMEQGALVIDVRGQEQFDHRHIPGAILISVDELNRGIPAKLQAEARERPIIVYCGQGLGLGPEGTAILNKAGFARAVNLKSGIDGWVAAGLPVVKS